MILDDAQFSPHWIPSSLGLVMIIGFCSLGIWQLDRAEQKQQLAQAINEREQQSPLMLNQGDTEQLTSTLEHRTITALGRYIPEMTVFVENRKYRGQTGFYVITPLKLNESNQLLLVNRGWVKALSSMSAPEVDTPEGIIGVSGVASIPAEPVLDLRPDLTALDLGPQRWPFFTLQRFSQWSNRDTYPWLMLLSADSESGFVRKWPKPRVDDSMHIGYALQWFAFAFIVLLIWTKLSIKKQRNREAIG